MDSSSLGERLHTARVQLGISLDDIAASTRINVIFLKELEEGRIPNVPYTYVRAFVKAFAEHVNLDVQEMLQYIETPKNTQQVPKKEVATNSSISNTEHAQHTSAFSTSSSIKQVPSKQLKPLLLLIMILISGLIVYVVWLRGIRNDQSVQEISFTDVVKEHEAKQPLLQKNDDSSQHMSSAGEFSTRLDSLLLEAVARDSVWVHIVVDGGKSKEYIFTKFSRMHWKAKNSFVVSVGNAAGISLMLNGQKVPTSGDDRKPVRNIMLSRETLQKLQTGSTSKENG